MKKHGLSEIAQIAGVSVATVYRGMNNAGYVSPEVRSKIMKAASELGYVPSAVTKKRRLGIVLSQFEWHACNHYRDAMLSEISRRCSELDIGIEMFFPNNIAALEESFIRSALVLQKQEDALREKVSNVRFISLNQSLAGVPNVSTDDRWCMKTGIDYLMRHGCRRIMLVIPSEQYSGMNRSTIFREMMHQAGIDEESARVLALKDCPSVSNALKKAVFEDKIDAIFIGGEDMAPMITWELFRLGIRIPDDISLLSFEAPGSSCYMLPAHTTVQQDFPRLVSTAIDWAMRINDGEEIPMDKSLLLPGFFNERDSVRIIGGQP